VSFRPYMEEKIKNILNRLLSSTDKIVVAVSGGVDSVVLLDLLSHHSKNLIIVHVNHGIRRESDQEEKFIRTLAKKYGFPIFIKKLSLKKKNEEEARIKRYQYLRKIMDKTGAKYIVCAHHLDDQTETILLNLVRGCGPLEVWGMKEVENGLIRPLLTFTKDEIQAYAKKKRLKFVTDKSNKKLKYNRNRIRHLVIPELKKINPGLRGVISNEIMLGNELSDAVSYYECECEKKVLSGNEINVTKLQKYPIFIQKEVIKNALHKMTGKREGIYSKNINEILKLLESSGTKKTNISGFTVTKNYDRIIFDERPEKYKKRAKIRVGEKLYFNGFKISIVKDKGKAGKYNILLPYTLAGDLNIRTWKLGDRIKTKSGTKKLQDVFSDAKVPKNDREKWPVITSGKEIIWLPLLAASMRSLKESKSECLIIKVEK